MQSRITGSTLPVLEIGLEQGDVIVAPPGELSWMTPNVQMRTSTATAGARGLWGAITRAVSGGGLFMTEFSAAGGNGAVAFAARIPGQIMPMEVQPGRGYLVHRHGFLCATAGAELSTGLQRSLGAGIFGGEGFILQKIGGQGRAYVDLSGEVLAYDLVAGQTMRVHPGHVGLFQASVSFSVMRVPGLVNRYLGGDAHHFAVLQGPGRIWLQSMPIPILAGVLGPYMGDDQKHSTVDAGLAGGAAGGLLGDLFR
jgi:uncharacterized protein (AIM24 family)